jgi:hypothetical protein
MPGAWDKAGGYYNDGPFSPFLFHQEGTPPRYSIQFPVLASTHLSGQWLKYPTAGVPRKADGMVYMSAATPRMANGKPDLSGIWTSPSCVSELCSLSHVFLIQYLP